VQVDPIKPTLKAPGIRLLKLKRDKVLSGFAFNFNLRRHTKVVISGGSTSLTSHFVLGVKNKTPCGIVRALLAAAARAGLIPAGAQAE